MRVSSLKYLLTAAGWLRSWLIPETIPPLAAEVLASLYHVHWPEPTVKFKLHLDTYRGSRKYSCEHFPELRQSSAC